MCGYKRKDHYYRRAKNEGYPSRSAYKLKELDRKEKLFKEGYRVVDVGCWPGGWSKVALERVGKRGKVVGIDLKENCLVKGENFLFLNKNVEESDCIGKALLFLGDKADIVISDAAPNTTGVKFADHARSLTLVENVLRFSYSVLREGGSFLAKVFDGDETADLVAGMTSHFRRVKRERPGATRKESFEIYLVARGFKP